MRSSTVGAADGLSATGRRVVAPPHAAIAQGGSGPRGSSADLTVAAAYDDLLTNEGPGITARDRVRNINPGDARVSVRSSAHEARRVFEVLGQLNADRR